MFPYAKSKTYILNKRLRSPGIPEFYVIGYKLQLIKLWDTIVKMPPKSAEDRARHKKFKYCCCPIIRPKMHPKVHIKVGSIDFFFKPPDFGTFEGSKIVQNGE